jgi:hypothetical protein
MLIHCSSQVLGLRIISSRQSRLVLKLGRRKEEKKRDRGLMWLLWRAFAVGRLEE